MMITWKEIRREIKIIANSIFGKKIYGYTGWSDGSIVNADRPNYIRITLLDDTEIEAFNDGVSQIAGVLVTVYQDYDNASIFRAREPLIDPAYDFSWIFVKFHAPNHTWPGPDTAYIETRQILPLRPTVNGFILSVRQGWYKNPYNILYFNTETVDLTPYKPTQGARYILVYINNFGVLSILEGPVQATKYLLTTAHIPDLPLEGRDICVIRLYSGQTKIEDSNVNPDLIDTRFSSSNSSSTAIWGNIGGILSDQDDLIDVLSEKQPLENQRLSTTDNVAFETINGGILSGNNTGDQDLSGLVEEAPADSKQYARKDEAWVEVVATGGGGIGGTGYQEDLSASIDGVTASFALTNTFDTLEVYWNGQRLVDSQYSVDAYNVITFDFVPAIGDTLVVTGFYMVPEVPSDNLTYGRRNGEWQQLLSPSDYAMKGGLLRHTSATGSTNISTTSLSYVDMEEMSITFTALAPVTAEILFRAGAGNSIQYKNDKFRMLLDGDAVASAVVRIPYSTVGSPVTLFHISDISAGEHTVKIQWCVDGGTGYNRPLGGEERVLTIKEYGLAVVQDAPADGKIYGRKDNAWAPIVSFPNQSLSGFTSSPPASITSSSATFEPITLTYLPPVTFTKIGGLETDLFFDFRAGIYSSVSSTVINIGVKYDLDFIEIGRMFYAHAWAPYRLSFLYKISDLASGTYSFTIGWRRSSGSGVMYIDSTSTPTLLISEVAHA